MADWRRYTSVALLTCLIEVDVYILTVVSTVIFLFLANKIALSQSAPGSQLKNNGHAWETLDVRLSADRYMVDAFRTAIPFFGRTTLS